MKYALNLWFTKESQVLFSIFQIYWHLKLNQDDDIKNECANHLKSRKIN
jgi:hypothetical protein